MVGGWATVNAGAKGPPIYDLLSTYIEAEKSIRVEVNRAVRVRGA